MTATKTKVSKPIVIVGEEITSDQRSDEWFAARLGIPTSSEFKSIVNKTKAGVYVAGHKNYVAQLALERITGQKLDGFTSKAMDWGSEYEDTAKLEYRLLTGNEILSSGFWRHKTIPAGASPDGLVKGTRGGVEIKCPLSATHIATLRANKMPALHTPQVQGQMWICGLDWVDFISYDPRMPDNAKLFVQRIYRDDDYINMLEEEITSFLKEVEDTVKFVKKWELKR